MTNQSSSLADFGWSPFFQSQLDIDDLTSLHPVRVMAVHRNGVDVAGPEYAGRIPPFTDRHGEVERTATVGDWLLLERETSHAMRLLDRKSLFKRRAPGVDRKIQLIAANVETLFIVSSCNQDFSIARLERYLALARDADVNPIIILTKADLTDAPDEFVNAAMKLQPGLLVETVNAHDPDHASRLSAWCGRGQTVALVGSSGVGKSTLINTLTGLHTLETQAVRADDDKGRHTTTGRTLHRLPAGGWLVDTPGMRELQLTDTKAGVDDVFADFVKLAEACRFADCNHESEPGCAIRAAMDDGALDPDRLKRWRKLVAEDAFNSRSLAERRARDKGFGKMVKGIMAEKRKRQDI